jgi:hypothetical protein
MFVWKHPKYYKELRKNNLTKENFSDKGEEDEKIQSKINRTRDRGSSDNPKLKQEWIAHSVMEKIHCL